MTAMFPGTGVPAAQAANSIADVPTLANCNELWYSTFECLNRFDPAAANAMLSEILNVISKAEMLYSCAKIDNLQVAIEYLMQRGLMNNEALAGGPTAYTATLTPKLTRYNELLMLRVIPPVSNTGAAPTLAVDGLPALPIVNNFGGPLEANDFKAGAPVPLIHYAGKWFTPLTFSQIPLIQEINLNIYVNWELGNDSNTGTAPGAGNAFKTIQRAINQAFAYPPSQFSTFIWVADSLNYHGFYTPSVKGPNIFVTGNIANPQNVVVTGQNGHTMAVSGSNIMTVRGITATTTPAAAGPGGGFISSTGAQLTVTDCRVLYVTGAAFEAYQANLNVGNNIGFAGNVGSMFFSLLNGLLSWHDRAIMTIEAPITVGNNAVAGSKGVIQVPPNQIEWINPENVTGRRYSVSGNGVIGTSGGGPNFFPGTIAGATATGGQYL